MRCPTLNELPPPPPGKTGWPFDRAQDKPWTEESPQLPDTMPDGSPWPRISIVTPSYNQAQFIEETIRSVLLQGYPDLEYIIIDGSSTDQSVDIIRKYEPWLAYWVSEPDYGQAHAINKGFQRATGDILAWLNSDDVYRVGVLYAAAATFQRHPKAGLVYGHAASCDQDGTPSGRLYGRSFDLAEMITGSSPVAQPSAFFRRDVFHNVGGLDESLHFILDVDLWLRFGLASEAVFVDEVWSDFRHHPSSKTEQGILPFRKEYYQIIRRAFESSQLPARFYGKRKSILARLLMQLAVLNYKIARDTQGRLYALRALWQDTSILKDARQRKLLLLCLIGRQWVLRLISWRARILSVER